MPIGAPPLPQDPVGPLPEDVLLPTQPDYQVNKRLTGTSVAFVTVMLLPLPAMVNDFVLRVVGVGDAGGSCDVGAMMGVGAAMGASWGMGAMTTVGCAARTVCVAYALCPLCRCCARLLILSCTACCNLPMMKFSPLPDLRPLAADTELTGWMKEGRRKGAHDELVRPGVGCIDGDAKRCRCGAACDGAADKMCGMKMGTDLSAKEAGL